MFCQPQRPGVGCRKLGGRNIVVRIQFLICWHLSSPGRRFVRRVPTGQLMGDGRSPVGGHPAPILGLNPQVAVAYLDPWITGLGVVAG